jgi:hypothetical protein
LNAWSWLDEGPADNAAALVEETVQAEAEEDEEDREEDMEEEELWGV